LYCNFHPDINIKKRRAPCGTLASYKFNYLYTKIPLSVFKIKIEIIKGEKIFVYNIHIIALLVYKSNAIIKISKRIIEIYYLTIDILKDNIKTLWNSVFSPCHSV